MISKNDCGVRPGPGASPSGPLWQGPRGWLSHLALSQAMPQWLRGPQPHGHPLGGLRSKTPVANSVLPPCVGPEHPHPARPVSPFGLEVRDQGPGNSHRGSAQNCEECQRQTSSLFNQNERTSESLLKIHDYAQGNECQPLRFLVGRCPGQGRTH